MSDLAKRLESLDSENNQLRKEKGVQRVNILKLQGKIKALKSSVADLHAQQVNEVIPEFEEPVTRTRQKSGSQKRKKRGSSQKNSSQRSNSH